MEEELTQQSQQQQQPTVISFGYRCSSASILKYLNIKTESYPFDWLVSRLGVIRDCIETDFAHFLDTNKYRKKGTRTVHYDNIRPAYEVCQETIVYNSYYVSKYASIPIPHYHTPQPWVIPQDTYAYPLAMNHHDILNKPEDLEYYNRCVNRFRTLIDTPNRQVTYLYIHPALSMEEYIINREALIRDFCEFQKYVSNTPKIKASMRGICIIPIKTAYAYPITDYRPEYIPDVLCEIYSDTSLIICSMYVNSDFIDAGEIFCRNAYIETDVLCAYVAERIKKDTWYV